MSLVFRWFNGFPAMGWLEYHGTGKLKSSWTKHEGRVRVVSTPHVARAYIDDDGTTLVVQRGAERKRRDSGFPDAREAARFNVLEITGSELLSSVDFELTPPQRADFQRDNLLYADHWVIRVHMADGGTREFMRTCAPREHAEGVFKRFREAFIDHRPRQGWKRPELDEKYERFPGCGPFGKLAPKDLAALARQGHIEVAEHNWPLRSGKYPVVRWVEEVRNGAELYYFASALFVSPNKGVLELNRVNWDIGTPFEDAETYAGPIANVKRFVWQSKGPREAPRKYGSSYSAPRGVVVMEYKTGSPKSVMIADSESPAFDGKRLAAALNRACGLRAGWW